MTLRYKNGTLIRSGGQLCTNCCDALVAAAGIHFSTASAAGLTGAGSVLWIIVGGTIRDVVRTATTIYYAIATTSVSRWTLSGVFIDTITSLNCNGIDVDSDGNVYIAHNRSGGVSVTKVNSSGTSQWTYDTGGHALAIKLNADESEIAVVGDRADNGGGNKTLWVLAASNGVEQWTFQDSPTDTKAASVDWDAVGNVYITIPETAIPFSVGGCRKIDSSPAVVWRWDAFSVLTTVVYSRVITDNVNVYVSYHSVGHENLVGLTVAGNVGTAEGVVAWPNADGGEAAALDADGNLYSISDGGDVFSIDPSDGATLWTASSAVDTGTSIHAGSKPSPLPWSCSNTYIIGDIVDNGGAAYPCSAPHISCGDALWAAGDYTIGDRVFYPTQTVNNAYRLTNSNKTGADTTPPDSDADWIADNDEPGSGNNWTDYWDT